MTYTIPIALPLLFFSVDIRQWFRLAGVSIFAFLLQTVVVLVGASAGDVDKIRICVGLEVARPSISSWPSPSCRVWMCFRRRP